MGKGIQVGAFRAKPAHHRTTGRNQLGVGKLRPVLGGGDEQLVVFMMVSIFIAKQYPCERNSSGSGDFRSQRQAERARSRTWTLACPPMPVNPPSTVTVGQIT